MASSSELLKNQIVLITGCNRGIGKAILETFARNGAIVYASSRKEGIMDELAKEFSKKYSTTIIPLCFDVTDVNAIKQAFTMINKEHKRLDCLVNNAGIMQDALIGMATETNIQNTFNVNVFAVINLIQYATKLMKKQNSGSIINVSSIVGTYGNPGQIVYSASKGAVISLTKTAAKELASYNIRVNAITPGMIDTDMFRSIGEPRISERILKIGMGRLGTPEEVANTALFLASDMSAYVTGQIIGVDGSAII
jgi:3-oxoacyl-[acyl-carrier protein] reductase